MQLRTIEDLDRAVKVLATHFKDEAVVVVGSQGILVGWDRPPEDMRKTEEIDAYPAHYKDWEKANSGDEASEETAGLFGQDSNFHATYGFYIDGVDERTAKLPPGWQARAVTREVKTADGKILAIAPNAEDLIVSKMSRLAEKDRTYVVAYHDARGLDLPKLKKLFRQCGHHEAQVEAVDRFLDSLPKRDISPKAGKDLRIPPFPPETHAAFLSDNGYGITIRERDEDTGLYIKRGNTMGAAHLTASAEGYLIGGQLMSENKWREHPDVVAARAAPVSAPAPKP